MLVQLLLFPFGYFIALFIGGASGYFIMSALKESEDTCFHFTMGFATVAFIFAFFFTLSMQGAGLMEVLVGLVLCGLSGPIIGFALYVLLTGGYHFRRFRMWTYQKVREQLN